MSPQYTHQQRGCAQDHRLRDRQSRRIEKEQCNIRKTCVYVAGARDVHADKNAIIEQIRNNYVNYSALPDDLPDALLTILRKMLATDPADRYESCADLARELEYYIYKDGYGPTIVSLADYMKDFMPGRFAQHHAEIHKTRLIAPANSNTETAVLDGE